MGIQEELRLKLQCMLNVMNFLLLMVANMKLGLLEEVLEAQSLDKF